MKPHVLFINGVSDNGLVKVLSLKNNKVNYLCQGSINAFRYLENEHIEKSNIVLDSNDNAEFYFEKNTDIFFNEISEADSNRKNLIKVKHLVNQFQEIPCINHPKYVLQTTRELVSQNLHGIENLIVPLTIRVAPLSPDQIIESIKASGLELPVLIREIGVHGGKTTYFLNNADEVRQLYALALDGRDYYLTQYYDYKEDGVYQKYRFVVINGEVFISHFVTYDHWMVHYFNCGKFMENNPQYEEQEKHLIENFESEYKDRIQPTITEIYKKIRLDFFGIDCSIDKQGQICLFEVNSSMNIFHYPSHHNRWEGALEKIKNAVIEMLIRKSKQTKL